MYHPTFQQQLGVTVSLYASFEAPPLVFQFQWLEREGLHGVLPPEIINTSLCYTSVQYFVSYTVGFTQYEFWKSEYF